MIPQEPSDHRIDSSRGVSEVISSVLLISLVVVAVSLVAVLMFSQPLPDKIPNLNFMVGTDNSENLYLYHNGGDALKEGQFSVVVDGNILPHEIVGGGDFWSLGKTIVVTGVSPESHDVVIVYDATGSGSTAIRSGSAELSVTPAVIHEYIQSGSSLDACGKTGFVEPSCYEYVSPSAVVGMYKDNLSRHSVSLYKQNLDASYVPFSTGQVLALTVTDTSGGSSIIYNNTATSARQKVDLQNLDSVRITIASADTDYFFAFGVTSSIWEIAGNPVYLVIDRPGVGDLGPGPATAVELLHTRIMSYDPATLQSTLQLTTPSRKTETVLVVNNTPVINGRNTQLIQLSNIKPSPGGLFLIDTKKRNPGSVHIVGRADSIRVDGSELNAGIPYCPGCIVDSP